MPTESAPRVEQPRAAQMELPHNNKTAEKSNRKHKRKRAEARLTVIADVPARNTRLQSKEAAAPPSTGTRASTKVSTRISRLMQPTVSKRSKTRTGHAAAVEAKRSRRKMKGLTNHIQRLENEVHQSMAVMDADTSKLLNYRQLMRDPEYKKKRSTSSANEFGRLANGVGGRINNPTNTIKFITKRDVPS